jgi:hypothetical protein
MLHTPEVQFWLRSTDILLAHKESGNEASRYILRLRCRRFRVGITVALSCLWQDCNHEDLDARCGLRR